MRTEIHITGQINGNYTLRNALSGAEEIRNGMFNSHIAVYTSKAAAKKALSQAYRYLRGEIDPSDIGRIGGLRYSSGNAIYWDASQAVIQ